MVLKSAVRSMNNSKNKLNTKISSKLIMPNGH